MVAVHTSSSEIPESNNDHHMSGIICDLNYTVQSIKFSNHVSCENASRLTESRQEDGVPETMVNWIFMPIFAFCQPPLCPNRNGSST